MNSPAMTWKVRRVGRTLWSTVRTRSGTAWSWIDRVHRGTDLESYVEPSTSTVVDEPLVTGDAYHWLAALRLDRAAYATSHEVA
jgi:hypothetical protein